MLALGSEHLTHLLALALAASVRAKLCREGVGVRWVWRHGGLGE